MNTYGLLALLLILVCACGPSDPETLDEADVVRLSLVADFDEQFANSFGLLAGLTYRHEGEECPTFDLSADVDGIALASSSHGTEEVEKGCKIGFLLDEAPPPAAAESTIRFHDGTDEASFTVARLLDPRFPIPSMPEGTMLSPGERVEFTWPVDTDVIDHVDAWFARGTETEAEAALAGDQLTVFVPSLAPGDWTLSVLGVAHGSVVGCEGAEECSALIFGATSLPVTIE